MMSFAKKKKYLTLNRAAMFAVLLATKLMMPADGYVRAHPDPVQWRP